MDWVIEPVGRGEHTLGKFPSYLANSPRDFHHMMGIRLFNGMFYLVKLLGKEFNKNWEMAA